MLAGSDIVNREKIWMVERCGGQRLLLEPAQAVGSRRVRGWQELEGDAASKTGVDGLVHLAHATSADRAVDLVDAEAIPCHDSHAGGSDYSADEKSGTEILAYATTIVCRPADDELAPRSDRFPMTPPELLALAIVTASRASA